MRLWDSASGQGLAICRGHSGELNRVTFSTDGSRLATAGDDCVVRIWRAIDGSLEQSLEPADDKVYSAVFSPDGAVLATAGREGRIRLWDTRSWKQIEEFYIEKPDPVQELSFAGDSSTLVVAADQHPIMRFSLLAKDRKAQSISGPGNYLCVATSHSGQWVAAAIANRIEVFDASGTRGPILRGHTGDVSGVAFSPDDTQLATASNDGTIRIWDWKSQKESQQIVGHFGRVWSVAFLPDGKRIVTGGADKTIRIWDLEDFSKQQPPQRIASAPICSIAASRENRLVATQSTDRETTIWDSSNWSVVKTLKAAGSDEHTSLAFSPDGKTLALGLRHAQILLFDTDSGQQTAALHPNPGNVGVVAFSPDAKHPLLTFASTDISLWDPKLGTECGILHSPREVSAIAFRPHGGRMVSAAHEFLQMWDIEKRQLIATRKLVGAKFNGVDFSPDGTLLATACSDKLVRLWDAVSLEPRGELADHRNSVERVAFQPTGGTLASLDIIGDVKVWHVATGQVLLSLFALPGDGDRLAFVDNGQQLIVGGSNSQNGRNLYIW